MCKSFAEDNNCEFVVYMGIFLTPWVVGRFGPLPKGSEKCSTSYRVIIPDHLLLSLTNCIITFILISCTGFAMSLPWCNVIQYVSVLVQSRRNIPSGEKTTTTRSVPVLKYIPGYGEIFYMR